MAPIATIGGVSVTRIEESIRPSLVPSILFPDFEPDSLERHRDWLIPEHYDDREGRFRTSVHGYLVRTAHHVVLIDACGGNDKVRPVLKRFHQQSHPWLGRLAAAGVAPAQVDYVICTHLHCDHVGWNTRLVDGHWVPTFPRARYLFHRPELARWDPAGGQVDLREPRDPMWEDSVAPVIEAGLAQAIDAGHRLDDALTIESAPGHTLGHVKVRLSAGGEEAIFCGDVMHVPLQVYYPHWHTSFDDDPQMGIRTRRTLLDECAERGALLLPTHFAAPHACRIVRAGEGFSIQWIEPGRPG